MTFSKSKKSSVLCFVLAFLIVFSAFVPMKKSKADGELLYAAQQSTSILIYQPKLTFANIKYPTATPPTPSALQGIMKGFAASVATRAVEEITWLLISEDIPGLSKALVALQDPGTRAELQHQQLTEKIAESVANIEASVERIEDQLADISNKIESYATAEALRDAILALNETTTKYQTLWGTYQQAIISGDTLASLETLYPEETRTDEQKLYISSAKKDFDLALSMFINAVEEGGGFSFLSDLEKLPWYIWNPSDLTSDYDTSYLGAYEAYLRERYTFEHQITSYLSEAFEMTIDIQTQMLTLYREYYTYKQKLFPDNESLKVYTNEYFAKIQYGIVTNIAAMAESTEFDRLLRPRAYTEAELDNIRKIDPEFVEGENIFSEITLRGKTYKAYKVRDNKTKEYFKIIYDVIPINEIVEKIYSNTTNLIDLGVDVYRPTFLLENRYSDDGLYELTSIPEQLTFTAGKTNVLAFLRDKNGCNLEKLPQTLTHFLFYTESFTSNNLKDSYWNVPAMSLEDSSVEVKTTKSIYSSSITPTLIYKDIYSNTVFDAEGVLSLNDKGLVENRTFVISENQILDLTEIELDIQNVTIILRKGGKVISNPNIKLENSSVIVTGTDYGDSVYITNLNVVSKDKERAALTIKSSCSVGFEGVNSFLGKSSKATRGDVYKYYNYVNPSIASNGILIEGENSIVSLVGVSDGYVSYSPLQKLTAKGAGGGAGICHNGMNLTVLCLDVCAEGSEISVDNEMISAGEQLYSIGAGIGASISCVLSTSAYFSIQDGEKVISAGDFGKNKTNYITIDRSIVSAKGVQSERSVLSSVLKDEIYSEDIGGIKIDGGAYYCVKAGEISNSRITLSKNSISERIKTKGDNLYTPETYQITAYTKGSNGVTTDGVYFRLVGNEGQTDWMLADGCGNDKGSWTGSVEGLPVGNILKVEVKTKSSNHWYPGKITVTSKLSGKSITVWGGRWIGNGGTTLLPTDSVYEVKVKTGSAANSGTDSGIYLTLKDASGKTTSKIQLSDIHQNVNAFEKGDSDVFPIYAPDGFTECVNALFYSDYKNAAAGWLLESFTVTQVQGGSDEMTFTANQWFENEGTINFGKYSKDTGSFSVEIQTSGKDGAGTDSDIWLTIHGTNGSTKEFYLYDYVGSENNFEKNSLECFNLGNEASIGSINKITIRKNNKGFGPDWKPSYVEITENLAGGQTGQSVKFEITKTIGNDSYDFGSPTPIVKSQSSISKEVLKGLKQNEDGSYTLSVNRTITISEEIFQLLKEKQIRLTVEMKRDSETIYSVFFDGSMMENYKTITLNKSYSFSDGNAFLDFLSNASLPEGTKVRINVNALGFENKDTIALLEKDENGNWKEKITLENNEGFIEISTSEGKELLLNKKDSDIPESEIPKPSDVGASLSAVLLLVSLYAAVMLIKKSR